MATEARSHFNNVIQRLLFAVSLDNFKAYPQTWKDWMTVRTSKEAYEESGYISGYGYLHNKPEGSALQDDARIQGPVKRWVHDTWALAARITEEAIEDVKWDIMKQVGAQLSKSAVATMHFQAAKMLMTGTVTTYHTAGDGLALFSGVHTQIGGGTFSNLSAAAAPTEASVTAAIQNFEAIRGHRGLMYENKATRIICGPSLEFKFMKILGSTLEPDTANNAINAMKNGRKLQLTIEPQITDNRWFVAGPKDPDVGFIHFDRIKPSMSRHGDPDTGDAVFVIRTRFSNECNDPRSMYMVASA